MMLNIKNLIATATQAIADTGLMAEIAMWTEIFKANFASNNEEKFKAGDEAFYKLLMLNKHDFIAEKMIEDPYLFLRAKILGAFFQGKSAEKVDGVNINREYPKATGPVAIKAAESVSAALITNLTEVMSRHTGGVGFRFWITDPKHTNYDAQFSGGKDAQQASGLMHCLLNVVDGDIDTIKQLREWFRTGFGCLPPGVYARVKDEALGIAQQGGLVGGGRAIQRQVDPIPEKKYSKPDGEKTEEKSARKKRVAKAGTGAEVDPMHPTIDDQVALAEYNARNGQWPTNNAMADAIAKVAAVPADTAAQQ